MPLEPLFSNTMPSTPPQYPVVQLFAAIAGARKSSLGLETRISGSTQSWLKATRNSPKRLFYIEIRQDLVDPGIEWED